MAIYHCSLQNISRSAGRSAIAAAAYRSTSRIVDRKTGIACDYTRKEQALAAGIELPAGAPEWAADRAELWNRTEEKENRKNSVLAHEINVAIPCEITKQADREKLIKAYCKTINVQGMACDWAIHAPNEKGDQRNYHAHIMFTTRTFENGDWAKNKLHRTKDEAREWVNQHRENWETCANEALKELHKRPRIDRHSLEEQGIGRTPQQHQGVIATQMERRGAEPERTRTRPGAKYISELYGHIEERIKFISAKLGELAKLPERIIQNRVYTAIDPKKSYNAAATAAQIEREQGYKTKQNWEVIDEYRREIREPPRRVKQEKTEIEQVESVGKKPSITAQINKPEPRPPEIKKPQITAQIDEPTPRPSEMKKPATALKPEVKRPEITRKPETRDEAVKRIADSLKMKTPKELAELKYVMQVKAEREAFAVAAVPFIEKDINEKQNAVGMKIADLESRKPDRIAERGEGLKLFATWKDSDGKNHFSYENYAEAQQSIARKWGENIRRYIDERDRLADTAGMVEKAKTEYGKAPDAAERAAVLQPVKKYIEKTGKVYADKPEINTAAAEKLKIAPEFETYRRWTAAIGAVEAERRGENMERSRLQQRENRQRGIERDGWEL
jgi:hypothetical protein